MILEYILMVVVAIGISAVIIRILVSKNPDSPGALLSRWNAILVQIGQDDPNKSK